MSGARAAGISFGVAAATLLGACGLAYDLDALGPGEGGAVLDASDAADAQAGDTASAPCPSSRGPAMIDAGGVCIDRTEVSVADYAAFLDATRDARPKVPSCEWVTEWNPSTWVAQRARPTWPVVDVHYCHAAAYCLWAGKRLCGRIGGGAMPVGDAGLSPGASQWLHACTRGGERAYPYGAALVPGTCAAYPVVHAVGPNEACEGGYEGLFDMTGNVDEWVDACEPSFPGRPDLDSCTVLGSERRRGDIPCASASVVNRNNAGADLGFRCCGR